MKAEMVYNILGEDLTKLFKKHKVLLAGGTIRCLYCSTLINADMFLEEDKIKDYDIYFKDKTNMYSLRDDLEEKGYRVSFSSSNAITMVKDGEIPIQLILLDFTIGGKESIFNSFDFTICSGIFDFETEEFYFAPTFKEDNQNRKLVFNTNTHFPISSLIRVNKYTKNKKYTISNLEYLKIALSINKLNIKTYKELKEQLNGIDTFILKPLTDNMIDNDSYDINEFLEEMEKYLDSCFNKEDNPFE